MLKIKEARKGKNVKGRELAELLSVSLSHYYDMENSKKPMSTERLIKISNYLNVPTSSLLNEDIDQEIKNRLDKINDEINTKDNLVKLKHKLDTTNKEIKIQDDILEQTKNFDDLDNSLQEIDETQKKLSYLKSLKERQNFIIKQIEEQNKIIKIIDDLEPPTTPLLGKIVAGIPLLSEQNIIGQINIPINLVGMVDFALTVSGDSMIGVGIHSGDIVLCRQLNGQVKSGDIVIALINNDETTLKFFIQENSKAILRAANPKFPDIELKPYDIIQGNVVRILKEPPNLNIYREYIYYQDDEHDKWNVVFERALQVGLDPKKVLSVINAMSSITHN